jgi:hypothetical protein
MILPKKLIILFQNERDSISTKCWEKNEIILKTCKSCVYTANNSANKLY